MTDSSRIVATLEELILLQADARGFSLLPRQPANSLLAGRHASRLRGRGLAFEELRRYHAGDDIRTIDWKATARLRSTQVRVFTEERDRPLLLLVDQRTPMFFGSKRAMKSVAAVDVAALGAWRALAAGDRVGGLIFNEQEITEVRPHRSRTRVLQVLQELTRFNQRLAQPNAPSGSITLNDVLKRALSVAKHDHLVVLVSDLDGADAETERLVALLAAHNDVLVVAVYDPLGIALSGGPGMFATDRGRAWQVPSHSGFSDSFRESFEQLLDHWKTVFRSLLIPIMPISTAEPVPDQLRVLFGSRAVPR